MVDVVDDEQCGWWQATIRKVYALPHRGVGSQIWKEFQVEFDLPIEQQVQDVSREQIRPHWAFRDDSSTWAITGLAVPR